MDVLRAPDLAAQPARPRDRPLINGIGRNSDDARIVMGIIAMAATLQVRVIAKGVETGEQAAFLKMHGCNGAQGYYYRGAVTAECVGRPTEELRTAAPWKEPQEHAHCLQRGEP